MRKLATAAELPASVLPSIREAAQLLTLGAAAVHQLHPADLEAELSESLTGLAFLFGHSNTLADGESLETMARAVAELVRRRFPAFNLAEIAVALRRGAAGEWPQPNTLLLPNLPNISHWLRSYQTEVRAVALRELEKVVEPVALLAPTDPAAGCPELVTEWAATLAAGRPLRWANLDPFNVVYSWLARIGAFRPYLTKARHARMLRTVCWQLCQAPAGSMEEARQRKAFRRAARTGLLRDKHATALTNACRKFLLREWLHCQAARPASELLPWLEELAETEALTRNIPLTSSN